MGLGMKRLGVFGAGAAAAAVVLLLTAAQRPTALAVTAPGLWEIEGQPGQPRRVRRCVADTVALARLEHRRQACTQIVISNERTRTVIHYTCPDGGFGRSQIDVLTPRSLRIETQGIARGAPFNYVAQARRVGSCPVH